MDQHAKIDGIMSGALDSLRDMVDVNTVIGDPVVSSDGSTVIPISKVCFGFVSGGADLKQQDKQPDGQSPDAPFAGGAAAGVSVQPVGFLTMCEGNVHVVPAQYYAPIDRIIEMIPGVLSDIKKWIDDCKKPEQQA